MFVLLISSQCNGFRFLIDHILLLLRLVDDPPFFGVDGLYLSKMAPMASQTLLMVQEPSWTVTHSPSSSRRVP